LASDQESLSVIAPIYGCQDGCCVYLFAEIEYTETQVKWVRIAKDSNYFGVKGSDKEPLIWLNDFQNLVFNKSEYQQVFSDFKVCLRVDSV